jgi:NAD(P)-dependent dehydrogenase (short-subunit alcohol dehydrogenase family)
MQKSNPKRKIFPAQHQKHPGMEYKMHPLPEFDSEYPGSNKLLNKIAVVTGGDSGIGRAVSVAFAKEGADVAILYLNEHTDAKETCKVITEKYGRDCLLIPCDVGNEKECKASVKKVIKTFGRIDILVNNAAVHYPADSLMDISTRQLNKTFAVNIFSMFWITKAALPYMKEESCIINSSSVTAYRGSSHLIDYSATKGAIVSFTRSLSASLVEKKIRVNGVAPGPIWTPLVPASFPASKVKTYGTDTPMKRPGQPADIARHMFSWPAMIPSI